jgi:hypothetical protein
MIMIQYQLGNALNFYPANHDPAPWIILF